MTNHCLDDDLILEERQCQLGSSCMIFDFWWWSDVQDWYGLESRWHSRAPRRDSMRCLATREHPLIHKVQLSVKKKKGVAREGDRTPLLLSMWGLYCEGGVGRVSFNNEVYKFRFRMISDDISSVFISQKKKNCNTKNRIRFENLVPPPPHFPPMNGRLVKPVCPMAFYDETMAHQKATCQLNR